MTWISNVPSAVVSLAPSDNRSNGFLGNPTFSFSLCQVLCTTSSSTVHIYIPVPTHSNFISCLSFCFCKFMSYQFYRIARNVELFMNVAFNLRIFSIIIIYIRS